MLVILACYYQTFTRYQVASLVPDIHPMPVATTPFFLYLWHVTYADREEMREEGVSGCQASAWLPGMALRSVALFSFSGTETEPACWGRSQWPTATHQHQELLVAAYPGVSGRLFSGKPQPLPPCGPQDLTVGRLPAISLCSPSQHKPGLWMDVVTHIPSRVSSGLVLPPNNICVLSSDYPIGQLL